MYQTVEVGRNDPTLYKGAGGIFSIAFSSVPDSVNVNISQVKIPYLPESWLYIF